MNEINFTVYEEDLIRIYHLDNNPTLAGTIANIQKNLPYIEDQDVRDDVEVVRRKLEQISQTDFEKLF
ncbi:transposon-transfer assisting family protein [Butyricicoccus porcorum]|uniref:transposon-transfer assisting family protein n=1 Tax=Butyricicoccus porcorum TaxID=1945634 RepID=UPI003F4AB50B